MRIGVVKEIKPDESRVALTTAGVVELRRRGHEVLVETSAGAGSAMERRRVRGGRRDHHGCRRRSGTTPRWC